MVPHTLYSFQVFPWDWWDPVRRSAVPNIIVLEMVLDPAECHSTIRSPNSVNGK